MLQMRCESPDANTPGKWVNVPQCVQTCTSIYGADSKYDATYSDEWKRVGSTVTVKCRVGETLVRTQYRNP